MHRNFNGAIQRCGSHLTAVKKALYLICAHSPFQGHSTDGSFNGVPPHRGTTEEFYLHPLVYLILCSAFSSLSQFDNFLLLVSHVH